MAATENIKNPVNSKSSEENYSKTSLRKLQVLYTELKQIKSFKPKRFSLPHTILNLYNFLLLQSEVCAKLSCSACPKYRCTSLKMYDEHLKSKKHLRRKFRKESESVWYCEACKLNLPNDTEWVKTLKNN